MVPNNIKITATIMLSDGSITTGMMESNAEIIATTAGMIRGT